MAEWKAKRFWKEAGTEAVADGGFRPVLDGRPVRSPAKAPLILPTEDLAREVAREWNAQKEVIDPSTMPFTRMANAAIDKVSPQKAEVADMLAAYGDSDLLCYRAVAPDELVARQAARWDPMLDWAAEAFGARLVPVQGVIHRPQDPAALAALVARVHDLTSFELAAFHDLVSISGSLVIGFAAALGHETPEVLWSLSRLDEEWQEEQWGVDEDAAQLAARKRQDFLHAERFFKLCRSRD